MKLNVLVMSAAMVGLMAGCNSSKNEVAKERENLQETRAEAAKDVRDAQIEAVKDVNKEKADAAGDIQDAQKDLRDAQVDANREAARDSASGSTTAAPAAGHDAAHDGKASTETTVTADECAKLAKSKPVKPELKAKYDACAKLDKK